MKSNDSNKPTLPCQAVDLLPHRPPMLFIDQLTARSDDRETATAIASMNGKHFFQDQKSTPCPEFFIEIIAQTIAASRGFDSLVDGAKPKTGLLVGLDEFTFDTRHPINSPLKSHIKKIFEFGDITVFQGILFSGQFQVVKGKIQVWEKRDA